MKIRSSILPALVLACSLQFFLCLASQAQTTSEFTQSSQVIRARSLSTRDFWLTMNQIAPTGNAQYYMIYVTASDSTTVNIQVWNGAAQSFFIRKDSVVAFQVPAAWEVTSSGVVENKGIHPTRASLRIHRK